LCTHNLLGEVDPLRLQTLFLAWRFPAPRTTNLLRLERRLVRLQHYIVVAIHVVHPEVVVVRARQHLPDNQRSPFNTPASHSRAVSAERALELVEDAVVLVQVAELSSQVVVDVDRLDRLALHGNVPDLQGEVIPRQDISAVPGKLDVGDGGDNLGEEGFLGWVFLLLEFWRSASRVTSDWKLQVRKHARLGRRD